MKQKQRRRSRPAVEQAEKPEATSSASDPSPGGYDVGYGKPPLETRFKPGQSGNPKGRPKGAVSLQAAVLKELSKTVTVVEGGKERKMTKGELAATQIVQRAAKGDLKSFAKVLEIQSEAEVKSQKKTATDPDAEVILAAQDVADYFKRAVPKAPMGDDDEYR